LYTDTLANKRAELGWNVFNAPTTALPAMQNYQTASEALQQVPRAIQQAGLTAKYNEWVRTRPENLPYINQALTFLGLGTGTYTPAKTALQQINELMATGANAAKIGASVATM